MHRSSITVVALLASLSCVEDPEKKPKAKEEPKTVEGTIQYTSTNMDGETVCESTIRFTGSDYTGECVGCDYSFKVDTDDVDDAGAPGCEKLWQLSFMAEYPDQEEILFAFQSSYEDIAVNILWAGYVSAEGGAGHSDSGDYDYSRGDDPYWTPIAWEFTDEYGERYGGYDYYNYYYGGLASLAGGVISWTAFYRTDMDYAYGWFIDDCDTDIWFDDDDGADASATGFVARGALPCPVIDYFDWEYADTGRFDTGVYGSSANSTSQESYRSLLNRGTRGSTLPSSAEVGSGPEGPPSGMSDGIDLGEIAAGVFSRLLSFAASPSMDDTAGWSGGDDSGWSGGHDSGWGGGDDSGWGGGDDSGWGGEDEYRYNNLVDVWTIKLGAGDEALVSIDTLDEESMFNPALIITGPDSCPVAAVDDSFHCTVSEHEWPTCSAIQFEAEAAGQYNLIVLTMECGDSDEVTYQIGVDAPSDPQLTLVEDDILPYEIVYSEHSVTGTATILSE